MSKSRSLVTAAIVAGAALGLIAGPAPAMAQSYSNCAALNADYPHGVGKAGATDSTSGTPVTDFTVDNELYSENSDSDRDGDGIACEKR